MKYSSPFPQSRRTTWAGRSYTSKDQKSSSTKRQPGVSGKLPSLLILPRAMLNVLRPMSYRVLSSLHCRSSICKPDLPQPGLHPVNRRPLMQLTAPVLRLKRLICMLPKHQNMPLAAFIEPSETRRSAVLPSELRSTTGVEYGTVLGGRYQLWGFVHFNNFSQCIGLPIKTDILTEVIALYLIFATQQPSYSSSRPVNGRPPLPRSVCGQNGKKSNNSKDDSCAIPPEELMTQIVIG